MSPDCKTTCAYGWLDCDSNMTNGCEKQGSSCNDGAVVSSCYAADFDAATIAWKPPSAPTLSCTSTQLDEYANACFGSSTTQPVCDAWIAANGTCYACMVTDINAATSGPFVTVAGWLQANIGGCIALVSGDSSATSCGAKQQIADDCNLVACAACDINTFGDCSSVAATSVCSPYAGALCKTPDAGAVYDACLSETTITEYVATMGALFCGASSDAGADATDDASDAPLD